MKKINLKKISFFLFITCISLQVLSCQNDESMIESNGKISSKILNDPLFKELDNAFGEVSTNLLKYKNENVDEKKMLELKEDVKNKKITSYDEYFLLQEKAGKKDAKKRMLAHMKFSICQQNLFKKYPELAVDKVKFTTFFMENSKHKITENDLKELYNQNNEKR